MELDRSLKNWADALCFLISISFIYIFAHLFGGRCLRKILNECASDCFFLNSYLDKETKLRKRTNMRLNLGKKECVGNVRCRKWLRRRCCLTKPNMETEEANELIIRCDLSINKTRCYIEASEWGTSRVHRDISEEYLDWFTYWKIKLFFWNKIRVSLDVLLQVTAKHSGLILDIQFVSKMLVFIWKYRSFI